MKSEKAYQAIVDKVVTNGRHGAYVVARCQELSCYVTFSLDPKVWQEDEWPESGTYVVLYCLRKKRAGWRARYVRFVKPSDEKPSNQKGEKE